ncbi:MAG TPA: class I SAM-dependent methyltransferase [Pyrinomonadaceae bacterium]|nr:class I SAM-dependent methyltransferase [Pyrinomonadaceae bacterium]
MNSVSRFSSRVDNYAKYRPSYPPEILTPLRANCGLTTESIIADVGSGTGLLSEVFLRNGNPVFGIEPNKSMRLRAELAFEMETRFESVDGTAERTTLRSASVDFVVAGQAFHWFDRNGARAEFARILKPGGWVVLVWNSRRVDSTPFLRAYEKLLLHYSKDYAEVRHQNVEPDLERFFSPGTMQTANFYNVQRFDYEGLKGRLCSSSYSPDVPSPVFAPMIDELKQIFAAHNKAGLVDFEYDTKMFYGRL